MKHWGRHGKKNTELLDLWTKNTIANMDTIADFDNIWNLPDCLGKAIIVVGASPTIKEDCKYLKDLPEHYVVICVNSALKLLLDNGIKPHYVVAVDGNPVLGKHLDVGDASKELTLISCNSVSPEVFKVWKGNVVITPYMALKDKDVKEWVRKKFKKESPSGGNAFNNAVGIAAFAMKTSIIVFMGNELSWKGKNYYADKSSFNDGTLVFPTRGVDGRGTYSNTVLYQYKIWLEAFCQQNSDIVFYNCSRGILGYSEMTGYTPNIIHTDFPDAFQEINAGMLLYNDVNERERIKYNVGYTTDYHPIGGGKFWESFLDQNPNLRISRGLDVGCGPGYGVKVARERGYDVYGTDISDALAPTWEELGMKDYIQAAPADHLPFPDDSFDLVVCIEVLEHIPEEKILSVLKEIKRVAAANILLTIARTKIPRDQQWLAGKYQPHVTVKPWKWWKEKIDEAGLEIQLKNEVFKQKSFFVHCNPKDIELPRNYIFNCVDGVSDAT
jgi:2-polyprenyl-3-methyl-5-hydroxy-6-metoxy-1,4-benzoquinol methylase